VGYAQRFWLIFVACATSTALFGLARLLMPTEALSKPYREAVIVASRTSGPRGALFAACGARFWPMLAVTVLVGLVAVGLTVA
jgi:hypothetical protein